MEENMYYKTVISVLLIVVLCVGCSGGEGPAAGTWEGTSPLGDFSFEVDSAGENILTMTYDFTCVSGAVTRSASGTIEFVMPLEVSGGKFDMAMGDTSWNGRFSGRDSASGKVTYQDCSGDWEAAPQK
jgi:hypothetical protein